MKLYNNVDRVLNEIREIGKNDTEPLTVNELTNFDQLHYCGLEAVDFSINKLNIDSTKSILEIGSGLGGPARYIANKTGASVTALELQADQNNIAKILTSRCGLSAKVLHLCGDIISHKWNNKKFDAIVSWLTLFHIQDHQKLLNTCYKLLKPNGLFYAEDLYGTTEYNHEEIHELSTELFAQYLPSYQTYLSQLKLNNFNIIFSENMTNKWINFTKNRKLSYKKNMDRNLRVHGKKIVKSLSSFYKFIDDYFSGGKLGGIRVIAKKNSYN